MHAPESKPQYTAYAAAFFSIGQGKKFIVCKLTIQHFFILAGLILAREPLKNVGGEALARRIWQKKRSLHAVNEHFFAKFNAARASKVIFQRFPRLFVLEITPG